ncbi:hypothetical protein HGRIS_004959 [Hohenbuehelia grisea]|uniref:DUF202 domain-containing protein n=1 Tax=Hohenbuehelia grisea TaxID=104357 RepID=A0ABR3JE58_9AGAR
MPLPWRPDDEPYLLENVGSTARDFCMLERNVLSHLKLALLLGLLSSSVLLRARLVPEPSSDLPGAGRDGGQWSGSNKGIALASVHVAAALAVVAAGCWEYHSGFRDLRDMRAFLVSAKPHFAVMTVISAIVCVTCVILLVDENGV